MFFPGISMLQGVPLLKMYKTGFAMRRLILGHKKARRGGAGKGQHVGTFSFLL